MKTFDFRFQGSAGQYLKEFHGIESHSVAQVIDCPLCNGAGHYPEMESEDDFIEKMCESCGGTGKIITSTI